jgi:glutathione S-transferase
MELDPTAAYPVVYGAPYSVYVQAVRLTLWAKRVRYKLVEVDVFGPDGPPTEHLTRHPFGRIPAFEHGDLKVYETAPICRYIDEAFEGPALQPPTPSARAVMGQAISIMDSYAYRTLVWDIYVERVAKPRRGLETDLGKIAAARPRATICLNALNNLAPTSDWLSGTEFSLADLHAAPMFSLFVASPDASELMEPNRRITAWWKRISEHVHPAHILNLMPA